MVKNDHKIMSVKLASMIKQSIFSLENDFILQDIEVIFIVVALQQREFDFLI